MRHHTISLALLALLVTCPGCSDAPLDSFPHSVARADDDSPQVRHEVEKRAVRGDDRSDDVPDLRTRTTGGDWPGFLGPTSDSKSTETGIVTDWGDTGPPIRWHVPLATGYGMPSISRGRLFVFDRHENQARLTCLESETGNFLWKFEYPTDYEDMYGYNDGPRACPLVDEDRVYIHGVEGMLHCLNVVDGSLIWKVDTFEKFHVKQNFFGVGSVPVVEGDLLIVPIGGSPPGSPHIQSGRVQGDGSGIVAFDKRTGELRYQITDELAGYASPVLATIDGRRWCLAFMRGGLVGFDPATGKVDFHYPWRAKVLESVNASNPIIVDDLVFISECYGPGSSLLRVRPGGYDVVWSDDPRSRDKAMQTHWNTPVHHEGYLYGSSGRHEDAELRCIDLETGKVMWSEPNLTRSSLLYVDGHFICLTEMGELILMRATSERFDPVARVELRDSNAKSRVPGLAPPRLIRPPAWAAPIVSHGLLYVRGADRLVCLELIPEEN